MIISVILPTRKRPLKAQEFLSSLYSYCLDPNNVQLVLCVDADDDSYERLDPIFQNFKVIKEPRQGLGIIINNAIRKSDGEIILLCNDDIDVKTLGWDIEIIKAHYSFPDKIYLMAPNDLNKKNSLFVFPVFSRKLFELLHFYPVIYSGSFIDTHIYELFKSIKHKGYDRILFLEHVHFEHKHFRVTGEKPDQTYLDRKRFADDKIFFCSIQQRINESNSIISAIVKGEYKKSERALTVNVFKAVYLYMFSGYLSFFTSLKINLYSLLRYFYKLCMFIK